MDGRRPPNFGVAKHIELGRVHDFLHPTCPTCGKQFKTKVKNVLRGGGKYCCIQCNPNKHRTSAEDKKLKARNHNLVTKYGITLEEFEAMEKTQGGVCAICHKPPSGMKHHGKLFVDHEHGTGKVRGLLCGSCNTAIGLFQEDVVALENAATYLKSHSF